jgi:surfeit locus 1 family protein
MSGPVRRLLVPTLTTVAMLAILVGLGVWQLERLQWKRGLLAQIAQAEAAPAIPLPSEPSPFAKVQVTGTLRSDLPALYGAEVRDTREGTLLGAQLIEPLIRPGAPTVLVDRGWVPMTRRAPIAMPPGAATVEGYVRAPDHSGLFSATDNVAEREFYTLDPTKIGAALGLSDVAPFTLVVLGPAPPELYPDPEKHLPRPPNDHLQYAVTWFGRAATLLVIFVVFARKTFHP